MKGLVSSGASLSLSFQMRDAVPASLLCAQMRRCLPQGFAGRVGEWLKPADCKSAAPCGLRRFESSPVHQRHASRANLKADRKSTRLNSSHGYISYAVFCLKKKKKTSKYVE